MSEKTETMTGDLPKEESPTTTRNSPEIINNTSAMLPEEMWEEIFQYLEYRDFLNVKIASKHFNVIATRVAENKYKWYELCKKKVPERHWCKILEKAQHPVEDQINCRNFHDEKEFATIWRFLYSTWIGWSTMCDKEPEVQEFFFNNQEDVDHGSPVISVEGNILAVYYGRRDVIRFYDILRLTAGPIYSIPCPEYHWYHVVSKKGTDLTATLIRKITDGMTIERWDVKPQELIYSETIRNTDYARVCESFGYLCTITSYWEEGQHVCMVEIRQVSSIGNSQYISFQLADYECIHDAEAYGDTLILLTTPDPEVSHIKLHKISIRECQLKETHVTPLNNRWLGDFLLYQHCVVAHCIYPDDGDWVDVDAMISIGFSVSGRDWKIYNPTRDLNFEAPIIANTLLYEGGVLALLMTTGNVQLIYVDDPDDLDSKLETLPSKIVTLNWASPFAFPRGNRLPFDQINHLNMCITAYNSKIYLIIAVPQGAIILEF